MNEGSSLPPIFPTESIPYDDNADDSVDPSLMQSFRDELLSSFDNIAPKVSQLERSFAKTITGVQTIKSKSNFNFGDQLNEIQMRLKEMHNKSIDMSRRVQSLTLTSQTASALAAPRLLRPINDSFCDFKDEFDNSLKNLTTLSANITEKAQSISSSMESLHKLPKSIEVLKSEISALIQKSIQSEKVINAMKENAMKTISGAENDVSKDIENQISDAEKMLKEMEERAKKGLAEADALNTRMQLDKETLRKSFTSLTSEIEGTTSQKLGSLNTDIEAASRRSNSLIESIQNQISDEFDMILKNEACEPESSILDQIEQAREESQLLVLMNKLDQLQEKIQNIDKLEPKSNQVEISIEPKEDEEKDEDEIDEEVFTKVVNGNTIKFYCRSDGTFHT